MSRPWYQSDRWLVVALVGVAIVVTAYQVASRDHSLAAGAVRGFAVVANGVVFGAVSIRRQQDRRARRRRHGPNATA